MNPFLAPHLSDAHNWRLSKSIFISATADAFSSITSLPAFSLNSKSTVMRQITSSLITPAHVYSPALLYTLSHLRTQHIFTQAVFSFIESIALGPSSILTDLARATWIASSAPGATCLFNAYCIPAAMALPDTALRTLFAIRFVLRPPGVKAPPDHKIYCSANCPWYSGVKQCPTPMPSPQGPLGIHYYGCNAGRRRTMRHDTLLRLIMAIVQKEWNCDTAMEDRELASGSSDPTAAKPYSKVDLIIWCPDMRPCVIAIDATVVSPTLPSYISETLKGNLFDDAAETKNGNHLQGCNDRERGFLPIVFNVHGGVGPDIARQWLHSIFAASFVRERLMGRSGVDTARRRELFMQSLHAVNTKGTDMMLSYCLKDAVAVDTAVVRAPSATPAPQMQPPPSPSITPLDPRPSPPLRLMQPAMTPLPQPARQSDQFSHSFSPTTLQSFRYQNPPPHAVNPPPLTHSHIHISYTLT